MDIFSQPIVDRIVRYVGLEQTMTKAQQVIQWIKNQK